METMNPPCGPARDAFVAKALGCTTWITPNGCHCLPKLQHDASCMDCSTLPGPAIEALEAWRTAYYGRSYRITSTPSGVTVVLFANTGRKKPAGCAPTLPDAATAAILATKGT